MFTGEVGVISNKATWRSQVYELVDEDDDTTTDLTAVAVLDIVVTVRGITGSVQDYGTTPPSYVYATASSANGLTNTLFFTAGPAEEEHGLFGSIVNVPPPGRQ